MNFDTEKYMMRAKQIDKEARDAWNAVNGDTTLTPAGKAPRFQEIDDRRKQKVKALQSEAAGALTDYVVTLEVDLHNRRAAAAKKERALVGDQIAFLLAEREIGAADTDDLVNIVERARDDWEKEVLGRLARVEAGKRGKGQDASVARVKLTALTTPPDAGELRNLEQEADYWRRSGEGAIADLDRRDYATRMHQAGLVSRPDAVE